MQKTYLGKNKIEVSRIGIGGHYKCMEEGAYENRYGYIDRDLRERCTIVEKAIDMGINYFDTTWRNESDMLARVIKELGTRDKMFINGMVLGAFRGSKGMIMDPEVYFNTWLDDRLRKMPGNRFDSFMINAIEEDYDERITEILIKLLEQRKINGDIGLYGFSTHNHSHARYLADKYPEFEIIMMAYNFRNRNFETAFEGYMGNASIIAMKPLVWAEYGLSFCALNKLPNFEESFGFKPDPEIATKAYRYILKNKNISTLVSSVNSIEELELLALADKGSLTREDESILSKYNELQTLDSSIPLFISGLKHDNLRMIYFSVMRLAQVLGVEYKDIPLNEENSKEKLLKFSETLITVIKERGYGKYLS